MLKNISKYNSILTYVSVFLGLFAIFPLLSPIFSEFGLSNVSYYINFVYQFVCHQRPWRSYHIYDYQIAYCAREVGVFGSLFISSLFINFINEIKISKKAAIFLFFVGFIPYILDGCIQLFAEISLNNSNMIPFYESTNFTRSLTGIILGNCLGFSLFPFLKYYRNQNNRVNWRKYFSFSILVSLLVIIFISLISYITSQAYKPSNPISDLQIRIPGYNYEVVSNGGHTYNQSYRIFLEDTYIQCMRAKIYMSEYKFNQCAN